MKTVKATRSPNQAPAAPGGALQDTHALLRVFVHDPAQCDPRIAEVFCQTGEASRP